jgi:hypothetical protein
MQTKPINTAPLERLLLQIKNADQSQQKQITVDIAGAKEIAYSLGTVLARLAGNYESLLIKPSSEQEIDIKVDGGGL